jgi:hypothetical protein
MSKIDQIIEGWRNKIIPPEHLKDIIDKVSNERMEICIKCPLCSINVNSALTKIRPDVHCTDCGCTLSIKTACLSCECPKEKWLAKHIKNDEK